MSFVGLASAAGQDLKQDWADFIVCLVIIDFLSNLSSKVVSLFTAALLQNNCTTRISSLQQNHIQLLPCCGKITNRPNKWKWTHTVHKPAAKRFNYVLLLPPCGHKQALDTIKAASHHGLKEGPQDWMRFSKIVWTKLNISYLHDFTKNTFTAVRCTMQVSTPCPLDQDRPRTFVSMHSLHFIQQIKISTNVKNRKEN